MDDVLSFKHPFTCNVSGPNGSGKSPFFANLLHKLHSLCTEQNFDGEIIRCSRERTVVPTKQLTVLRNNISLNEGVPENFEDKLGQPCIKIYVDLLNDVSSNEVCNLFTKGSHHRKSVSHSLPKTSFNKDGFVWIFR